MKYLLMISSLMLMMCLSAHGLTLKDFGINKTEQELEDIAQEAKRGPASVVDPYTITIQGACRATDGLSVYSGNPGFDECINMHSKGNYPLYQGPEKLITVKIEPAK